MGQWSGVGILSGGAYDDPDGQAVVRTPAASPVLPPASELALAPPALVAVGASSPSLAPGIDTVVPIWAEAEPAPEGHNAPAGDDEQTSPSGDDEQTSPSEDGGAVAAGISASCLVVSVPAPTRGPAWVRTDDRDSRLGRWASAREHGVWWEGGLWTDRFPMPAGEPVAAGARTMATSTVGGHLWASLCGQRVGNAAWVVALAADGTVVCQWVVNLAQAGALMADLVGLGQVWPGDQEWMIERPQDSASSGDISEQLEPVTGAEETYSEEW